MLTWKSKKLSLGVWIATGIIALIPFESVAGVFEISLGFSISKSTYSATDFTWTRRYSASVAYHFFANSAVELTFQNRVIRNKVVGLQDTLFNDQIYSVNWIQTLLGQKSMFKPYFKVGIGQLNRDASGTYSDGSSPPLEIDSLTGVIGLGFKVFFMKNYAFRMDATTYLIGGSLATWQDNGGVSFGFSIYF